VYAIVLNHVLPYMRREALDVEFGKAAEVGLVTLAAVIGTLSVGRGVAY
jgi:hypothetical protein